MLTGVYEPTEGTVSLEVDGQLKNLNGLPPYKRTSLGMARTFQNIHLFKDLSVLENVMIAMHAHSSDSLFSTLFRTKKYYDTEAKMREEAVELLKIFELDTLKDEKAKNLAYGQQRELEIVRALATKPKILFLDEPAAGMNPQESLELMGFIRELRDMGYTILMIEHDMSVVMNISDRIYVIDHGKPIADGLPKEIANNKEVIEAYLGGLQNAENSGT